MTFYKVLVNGKSCHGGTMAWSLPKGKKPGSWHEVPEVSICSYGLHLTTEPARWFKDDMQIFEVEIAEDAKRSDFQEDGKKIAVSKCRLVRQLADPQEIADKCKIFFDGSTGNVVDGDFAIVSGGTIKDVRGGTIKYVRGGTIEYVRGGTIKDVRGGTIEYVSGGTIKYVRGGTIKYVSGCAVIVYYAGSIPDVTKDHAVIVDRSIYGKTAVWGNVEYKGNDRSVKVVQP